MDREQEKKYILILQILDVAKRLTDAGYGHVRFTKGEENNAKSKEIAQE